jgi:putative PIG3 family NAD(P)H quinone oxidoreductase
MDDGMQAVRIVRPGGPEVLEVHDVERPGIESHQVLVRVAAAGVNRADALQRQGRYPAPEGVPPDIPGLEYAGVVEAVGEAVTEWAPGDRVMGIVGGGAYAEYVAAEAGHLIPVPEQWSFEQAAAVPEAFVTAHDALMQVGVQPGESALVHAVGSGVGLALLQLARAAGARVVGTARTASKLERAERELGLERGILVEGAFDGAAVDGPVDVICDLVGGPYLKGNLEAVAPRGRIIVIGLTGGRKAEIDLGLALLKRVVLIGTVLRSRTSTEKADVTRRFVDLVLPRFADGVLRPVLDHAFPMREAAAAHRYMEENRNFGSIVLAW